MHKIVVCAKCRKMFVPVFGEQKCPECVAEYEQKIFLVENAIYRGLKQTVAEIVEYTRLPKNQVVKILKSQRYLNEAVSREAQCARCKTAPAQPGSEFCVDCRLELHQALGQLAGALAAKIGDKPYRPTSGLPLHNVLAEVQKKRERTSTDILRPRQTKVK
ncbi:MAG TPA: hypothetical protein VMZ06_06515 [Candidatus Bathyarchaeia archaeon]|nr:hypothetical protein [Candidatus Bathyarchaeia archaeon]